MRGCSTRSNRLRDLGNTVIVVEHDEEAILTADHVVDMGPGAGIHGGEVVAEGTPDEVMANPKSLTGQYLTGFKQIADAQGAAQADTRHARSRSSARAPTTSRTSPSTFRSACSPR